jgi:hypothetical protein
MEILPSHHLLECSFCPRHLLLLARNCKVVSGGDWQAVWR